MSKPLRVLQISGNAPPLICGIGDYTHELSRALRDLKVEVDLWSRVNSRYVSKGWSSFSVFRTFKSINFDNYDVVHLQYEPFSFAQSYLLPLLLARLKTPLVITFHEIFQRNNFQLWRDSKLAEASCAIIVNDSGSAKRIEEKFKVPDSKVHKIGVGSNIPFSHAKRSGKEFLIGYFGFLNAVKRVDLLIESFALVYRNGNSNARLRLIGDFQSSTAERAQLESIIKKYSLESSIDWCVGLDSKSVADKIAECDLMVLPFVDGATPRRGSFQACLKLGKAIATTSPLIPDPELNLRNSTLQIARLDQPSLSEALRVAIKNPDLILELERSAKLVSLKYSWETIALKHVEIYQSIVL